MPGPRVTDLTPTGRRLAPCLLLLPMLATLSCGEGATAPGGGESEREARAIAVGDTVAGSLATASDSVRFSFRAAPGERYALFCQAASGGGVTVSVRAASGSSTEAQCWSRTAAGRAPAPLLASASETFTAAEGGTRVVTVRGAGAPIDFRMLVYPVRVAPERVPRAVAAGAIVEGETLDTPRDVDEFDVALTAGQEVVAFLQPTSDGEGALELRVAEACAGSYGVAIGAAVAERPPDLDAVSSPRFTVARTGACLVSVRAAGAFGEGRGAYRFQLYVVDRRPEVAPALLPAGDTLAGEAIERVGDVDVFTVVGQPGARYNLFAQAQGDASSRILVTLPGIPGEFGPVALQALAARREALTRRATGTFALPASGTTTVRVEGTESGGTLVRGPYRLLLYPIDPRPEGVPAALSVGAGVEEAVALAGDLDEFTLTVPTAIQANAALVPGDTLGTLVLDGLPSSSGTSGLTVGVPGLFDPRPRNASGPFALPAGSYTLRVRAGVDRAEVGGRMPYRLSVVAVDTLPEGAAASVAVGDTVRGAIDPYADQDHYGVDLRRGERVFVSLLPGAAQETVGTTTWLRVIGANPDSLRRLDYGVAWVGPALRRTARIDVDATGRYGVRVSGDGYRADDGGPYRFVVERANVTPETHGATLAPGDSVTDERLDFAGDVDEFDLVGAPRSAVTIRFTASFEAARTRIEVADATTAEIVRSVESFGYEEYSGAFTLPASGRVRVAALHSIPCPARTSCVPSTAVGAYRLTTLRIDSLPERVGASAAVGDTVSGEEVAFPGDVDDFVIAGTAGQRVTVYLQTPFGTGTTEGVRLELVDPATGAVLGSAAAYNPDPFTAHSTGPVVLPATRSYTVRVRSGGETRGGGRFRFLVAATP